jgi:Domain of unknown function (DUF4142)
MGGFDRMLGACAAFILTGVLAPVAMAKPPPTPAAERQAQSRAVVPLSLLHHVAQRELELGLLAQVAAVRPETMRFANELETDFRLLDRRILAIAEALGIGENRLRQAYADQNTVALERDADDLDRLSMLRGEDFDRRFWVTVERDQLAASALLASAAGTVSSLDPLVADTVRLLDRSIRRAAAAQTSSNKPPSR